MAFNASLLVFQPLPQVFLFRARGGKTVKRSVWQIEFAEYQNVILLHEEQREQEK